MTNKPTTAEPGDQREQREARAREELASQYRAAEDAPEGSGRLFHAANVRVMHKRNYADWKDRAAIRAMLTFSDAEKHLEGEE